MVCNQLLPGCQKEHFAHKAVLYIYNYWPCFALLMLTYGHRTTFLNQNSLTNRPKSEWKSQFPSRSWKKAWGEEVEVASLDMLPGFGCSQLRSLGALEGGHCQGGIVLTMFQARHCRALRQPQQLQERHCDDRGDVGSDDIVIKWSEQKKETNIIIRAGEMAAALVFEENVIVDLIASNFPLSPSEASKR